MKTTQLEATFWEDEVYRRESDVSSTYRYPPPLPGPRPDPPEREGDFVNIPDQCLVFFYLPLALPQLRNKSASRSQLAF